MRQMITFILVLFSLNLFADTIPTNREKIIQNQHCKCSNTKDTSLYKGYITLETKNKQNDNNNMPWIIALIIGIISAIVNIVIAILQHKSNQRTINKQLENARIAIKKQIKNSKEIAMLDFNRSVKSQNRQEWINKLRDLISEIDTKILNVALADGAKTTSNIMEITWLKNKIELMINQTEEEHRILFTSLTTLIGEATNPVKAITAARHRELRDSYFNAAKAMFKMEWERVKKGE